MKTTRTHNFDHVNKAIIITSKFAKKANSIGTDEYNQLLTLRRDFPDYSIKVKEIKRKEDKVSYRGLTIDEMKRFINEHHPDDMDAFERSEKIIAVHSSNKYARIKKWFLDNYKDEYNNEMEALSIPASVNNNIVSFQEKQSLM